ncbi:MFS transporter [Chloroflexota bacterium]
MRHLYYGWVMVLLAMCVLATHALVIYTFGVFLKPLTTEFGWERGALSGALSTYMLSAGILAIFVGRLSDRYGPRIPVTLNGVLTGIGFLLLSQISSLWQVYVIWGLLLGIGGSCCFIPTMSTIPRWFVKRRGIAIGLTAAGFGLGAIVSPPLAQWLISICGWQQAFIILGVITFVIVIPFAQLMKHSPQRMGLKPYGEMATIEDKPSPASVAEGLSFKQALKTGRFWIFGSLNFCFHVCIQVIIAHIVPHASDIGIQAIVAASILSIVAGISVIGRLSMGFVSDWIGGRLACTACLVIATLALVWLLFAGETWMFYVFGVVYGLAYGGFIPLMTMVPAELFGPRFLGVILGSVVLFGTVGGALGPLLAGSIFDVTGEYRLAFLISVVLCALAFILSLILLRSRVSER